MKTHMNKLRPLLLLTLLFMLTNCQEVFVSLGCHAQTIVPLYHNTIGKSDVYYKDTFNDLDNFTGTWKYTSGTTSLTIVLHKKLQQGMHNFNGSEYEMDVVIGGYKYIENGIILINTLPQLSENLDVIQYNINGSTIIGPNSFYCIDCEPTDRMLFLGFIDPEREIFGYEPEMLFKRVDSGGQQKLKLTFRTTSGGFSEESLTPQYTSYTVPFGEYLLVKQP